MLMKKSVYIAILLTCVLTSAAISCAFAQTGSLLGVKPGDNFTYTFEVFWSSTDPNAIAPQEFSNMNQTLLIHMNVTDVGPTMASLNITTTLRGGTVTSEQGYVEVSRGGFVGAPLFIIGANLTAGGQVYPQSDPAAVAVGQAATPFTINETVNKVYLGTARPVNHYTESSANATSGDQEQKDLYYDQATGVLLEMTLGYTSTVSGESDSEHWKINQFNNAEVPSDGTDNGGSDGTTSNGALPSWLVPVVIAVVAVVVVVLIAAVMLRRRKKPEVQPSAPAQTPPSAPPGYEI